jgi:single stranded DNA-binding protein
LGEASVSGITATLTGRLGKDPELRYTGEGAAMLTFSVAVLDDRARPEDATQWVRVAVFGDRVEELDGTLARGDLVAVEGRLRVKVWRDQPDVECYAWTVEKLTAGRRSHRRRPAREPVMLGVGSSGRHSSAAWDG